MLLYLLYSTVGIYCTPLIALIHILFDRLCMWVQRNQSKHANWLIWSFLNFLSSTQVDTSVLGAAKFALNSTSETLN
jgi:hypothetical protein